MRLARVVLLSALAAACSESTPPDGQVPVPTLETIPYALLGTGKIAFERITPDYHGIYLVDPVAQTATVIGSGAFTGPALSPDGQQLALSAYSGESGSADIFAHNTDGSGRRRISGYPGDEGVPSWTPDGLAVTFLRLREADLQWVAMEVQATDGAVQRTVTLRRADGCGQGFMGDAEHRVEVASNGLIAVQCSLGQVVILASDGTRIRTHSTYLVVGFAWSHDGSKLAVMEMAGSNGVPVSQTLHIVPSDGGPTREVFTAPLTVLEQDGRYPGTTDSAICWLKGVDRLLVVILNKTRRSSLLWVVNEDGTGLTKITSALGVTDRSVTCSR